MNIIMPSWCAFMSLAILCPLVAATNTCNGNDNCKVDDATSLMQLQSVVQTGHTRAAAAEEAQYEEEWQSEAEEADTDEEKGKLFPWTPKKKFLFKVPTGCRYPVCIGRAPFCGGNTEDCTSRNKQVIGWTKRCFAGSWATCLTGWKIHCAYCEKGFENVVRPTPAPILPLWISPKRAPKATEQTTTAPPITLPKFAVPEFNYKYENTSMGKAMDNLRKAYKHISEYKAVVCNVTKLVEDVKKNITLFEHREKEMFDSGLRLRRAAVRYAKKTVLANITLAKAEKAMDDAYMAQKGSQNAALRMVAVATNQKLHKVAGKKRLIDKKEDLIKAEEALRIGQIAVNHAAAQLAEAKRLSEEQTRQRKSDGDKRKLINHRNTEFAEELYVKKKMEKAYAEASPTFGLSGATYADLDYTRTQSNVPPWGSNSFVSAYDAGPPCHCVTPGKDCPCTWHPHP